MNALQFAGRYQCLPIRCSGRLISLQNEHAVFPGLCPHALFRMIPASVGSQYSVAGIATGLTAGARFLTGARDFSLHYFYTGSGAYPASCPVGAAGSFAGRKAGGA
jgi:hypothetical protein